MKITRINFFVLTALIVFLAPVFAVHAAVFSVKSPDIPLKKGDRFVVEVFLDTESTYINAIDGKLVFDKGLSVHEIRLGGSIVPLWVSAPSVASQTISFAGVIPGGYNASPSMNEGAKGNLFSVVFVAEAAGQLPLSFAKDTAAYVDDGMGTKDEVSYEDTRIQVQNAQGGEDRTGLPRDVQSPESFVPSVQSGEVFGIEGQVLLFATQDKDTGVSRYEVASSYFKFAKEDSLTWSKVESPYTIQGQEKKKYLFVRAIDAAGNTKIAVVPPQTIGVLAIVTTWWLPMVFLLVALFVCVIHFSKRKASYR